MNFNRELFESIFENMQCGIMIFSPSASGNVIYENSSARTLFEGANENAKSEFNKIVLKEWDDSEKRKNFNFEIVRKDGTRKHVKSAVSRLPEELFLCEVIRDTNTDKNQNDALTGLINRSMFEDEFSEKAKNLIEKRQKGSELSGAIVLINIDRLKEVNDKYGRLYGDKVVSQAAGTIKAIVSRDDVAARLGGAEFGLYMSDITDSDMLREKLRIICTAMNQQINDDANITVSCGAAMYPDDSDNFSTLLEKAGKAQYKVAADGGNGFELYSHALDSIQMKSMGQFGVYIPETVETSVFVRTFGYFDVFIEGKAVNFRLEKAKELLALLVDRRGGFVSSKEAISFLWEDDNVNKLTLSRYRKVAMRLRNILEENGIGNIMETQSGNRRVVPDMFECDLYNYISGKPEFEHLFTGSYMTNYSWSETTLADLEFAKDSF